MQEIEQELSKLKRLEDGWDGYSAEKISIYAINQLRSIFDKSKVVPSACGGVCLNIIDQNINVEIFIDKNGMLSNAEVTFSND